MTVYEARIVYEARRELAPAVALDGPEWAYEYMRDAFTGYPMQEAFFVIPLNRWNRPLGRCLITIGTLSSTVIHPREVFRPAILAGANGIIVAHNHPSGDPTPSRADTLATRRLREAGEVMDIPLHDHIIIGSPDDDPEAKGYFSYAASGLI